MHPFIRKTSHFAEIDDNESGTLLSLFSHERRYVQDDTVFSEDDEQSVFYVVKSGWFYSFTILPNGTRQIHDIYHAGDIIGLDHLSWSKATLSVCAATDGVLSVAPLQPARRLMFQSPHLSAIFYSLHMLTNVQLLDRITAVARLGAYESLAYFLCDALAQRKMIEADYPNELHLPLSQKFIADCLGLSAVHVSRQFNKLIENGMIKRLSRTSFRILNEDRLRKISDYRNRHATLDKRHFKRQLTLATESLSSTGR